MKIKSIAAVGAMGVGLGLAGLIGGTGTASAACSDDPTTRRRWQRANCTRRRRTVAAFQAISIDPRRSNIDILLNGDR